MSPHDTPPNLDPSLAALEPWAPDDSLLFAKSVEAEWGWCGWLAMQSLREEVALKFLPPEIRCDAVAVDDLRRETSRSRKLTHPNIVRIYDLFRDDRETFLSMEYVDGPNLSDLRVEQGDRVFPWKFLEPLLKQLCEALDYAHGEGVIHRDLKPANMMLDRRERLKLADFGIAAVVSDSVSRISLRHATSGTVTHMSPQQMDGQIPQASDDIYALGATMYELLTSRPPFYTGDIPHQVRNIAVTPIEERLKQFGLQNEVPNPVAAMVMACLSKDPAPRPPGARAVAEWIGMQTLAGDQVEPSRRPEAVFESAAVHDMAVLRSEEKPEIEIARDESTVSPARNRALFAGAAIAMIAVGLIVAAVFFWKDRNQSRPAAVANKDAATQWVVLFNGRDLDAWQGWNGAEWNRSWTLLDGGLVSVPGINVDLATRETFGNFELEFEWKVSPRANSGVLYRAMAGSSEVWQRAPEFQIVDDAGHRDGNTPITAAASMFGVRGAATKRLNGAGEFNIGRIMARGSHIEHWLNREKVVDLDLHTPEIQRAAFLKFRKATWGEAVRGHIVLQHMGHRVTFRSIRIRRLPE